MKRVISIISLSLILISCGGGSEKESTNSKDQSVLAQNYVSEIIEIMRENVLTKHEVDWGALESEVTSLAANAANIKSTYPAIKHALKLLKTNHSGLMSASGDILAYYSDLDCEQNFNMIKPTREDVGYIRIDGFSSYDVIKKKEYATNMQEEIAQQDNGNLLGWIVDLRNNRGGAIWPAIAGIGSLLNNGVYGHFYDADENIFPWGYRDGSSFQGDAVMVTVDSPYYLLNPSPKIAVLSSRRTTSAGEAALIAFKKQDNVKIFGSDSCGLSTGNQSFTLSDGSILFLSIVVMADKEFQKYGSRVSVEQEVDQEQIIDTAIEWLQN